MFNANLIKKSIFAAMISIAALSSCKKPVSVPAPPPPKPLQLIEFKSEDDVTKFDYNADGSLKTILLSNDPVSTDDNVTYTVKYLANKKIDELTGSNGARIKLSYNTAGILTKSEAFIGIEKISQTEHTYAAALLSTSTISVFDNNTPVPFFKSEFTFTSGNITRANVSMYNPLTNKLEPTGHVLNQYDTKINPLASLGDIMLVFWQAASKNNVTKQQYFNKQGAAEEVVETTYTYNAQGYPVSAAMRETAPGQQPSTATISFKYK